jgi:hypothetical protein
MNTKAKTTYAFTFNTVSKSVSSKTGSIWIDWPQEFSLLKDYPCEFVQNLPGSAQCDFLEKTNNIRVNVTGLTADLPAKAES